MACVSVGVISLPNTLNLELNQLAHRFAEFTGPPEYWDAIQLEPPPSCSLGDDMY